MAHSTTAHTIINGSRNLIVQYNIVSDGSADYSDFALLDVTDYTGDDLRQANNFAVKKVTSTTSDGCEFKLKFGDSVGNHRLFFETLSADKTNEAWDDGGLTTGLATTDMTVRITTVGFDASGDAITVTLWIKKKVQGTGNS